MSMPCRYCGETCGKFGSYYYRAGEMYCSEECYERDLEDAAREETPEDEAASTAEDEAEDERAGYAFFLPGPQPAFT